MKTRFPRYQHIAANTFGDSQMLIRYDSRSKILSTNIFLVKCKVCTSKGNWTVSFSQTHNHTTVPRLHFHYKLFPIIFYTLKVPTKIHVLTLNDVQRDKVLQTQNLYLKNTIQK